MIYRSIKGAEPHFDDLLKNVVAGAPAKRVIPLISPLDAKGDWREEIELARRSGTGGATIFSYSALTQGELWEKLTETVFAKPARVPPLAMFPGGNTGIIIGYVSDAETRKGIEDCTVEIRGTSQRTITSGDGFFALLNVTPSDNIAVLARREDVGSAIVSNISLAPQETKRIAFAITKLPK
jgi:hypothetical protein